MSTRSLPWTVKAAAACVLVYGLVVLLQPLVLQTMGISLGRRHLAQMLIRVVGAFAVAWGLFRRAPWAWWAAVIFTIPGGITGVLGVLYPGRFGHVHYLANTVIAPIAIVAIIAAAVLLLLSETRVVFRAAERDEVGSQTEEEHPRVGKPRRPRVWLALTAIAAVMVIVGIKVRDAGRPALHTEVVVTNLAVPWAVAFAPDGRLFVTERPGRVRIVRAGRLEPEPWAVFDVWQSPSRYNAAGLLGLALDPDFGRNHFVYVYHTYQAEGEIWNRVVRMIDRDGRGVVDRIILDRIHGNATHDGGRILFGPDGLLYIGTGDSGKSERAQDRTSLAGKILRITPDGGIPPGNPFPDSPVYSMGHRNVQGFGWHPRTKRLYVAEHGPTYQGCCRDEVNVIEPGKNYGWPVVTGAAADPRFVDPIANSGDRDTWAPGGAVFVTRGPWADSFVFTGLRGESLYRAVLDGPEDLHVARIEQYFTRRFGRLRDAVEGPDGALYFMTNNIHPIGHARPGDEKLIRLVVGP